MTDAPATVATQSKPKLILNCLTRRFSFISEILPLFELIIVELIFVVGVETGDDGGVDGDVCCIGGRISVYSLGSNRLHFVLFGLSLTSVISIIVGVILNEHLSGLIRYLTRINNLINLSDVIE